MNWWKFLRISSQMGIYFGEAGIRRIVCSPLDRRMELCKNASKHARRGLETLNLKVKVSGFNVQRMNRQNFLIVSNHMSYLDMLVMSSVKPCLFVTSVDMGEVAILGQMAELGGSIFVERRNRDRVDQDRTSIANALKEGHDVVLYPEGTSSDGSRILPFKKSLLTAAVEAHTDILPVALRYVEINGEPFRQCNHDKLCWYGKMGFLPHIKSLTSLKSIVAELHFLEPIKVRPDSTRDELAAKTYEAISTAYGTPYLPTVGKPEHGNGIPVTGYPVYAHAGIPDIT
jgi:lyso-ornithine lipid O-acyltransferase